MARFTGKELRENIDALEAQGATQKEVQDWINQQQIIGEPAQREPVTGASQNVQVQPGGEVDLLGDIVGAGKAVGGFIGQKALDIATDPLKQAQLAPLLGVGPAARFLEKGLEKAEVTPGAIGEKLPAFLKGSFGAALQEGALTAQFAIPGALGVNTASALGRGLLAKLAGGIAQATGSGLISAGERLGTELIHGKKLSFASKQAAGQGLATFLIGAALSTSFTLGVEGTKVVARTFASKVPGWALKQAMVNPDVITTPQQSVVEAGDDLITQLNGFADDAQAQFETAQNALNIRAGAKVNTKAAARLITGSKKIFIDRVKAGAGRQGIEIADDALENFVNGNPISYKEALNLNRGMHEMVKSGEALGIGSGFIGQVAKVKSTLLNKGIEPIAKGTVKMNKAYADAINLKTSIEKGFNIRLLADGTKIINEQAARSTAQELAGKTGTKALQIRNLQRFEELYPQARGTGQQLINAATFETFQNIKEPSVSALLAGSGAASRVGFLLSGVPGGIAGGILGGAAALKATEPAGIAAAIKAGQFIQPGVEALEKAIPAVSQLLAGEGTGIGQLRRTQ